MARQLRLGPLVLVLALAFLAAQVAGVNYHGWSAWTIFDCHEVTFQEQLALTNHARLRWTLAWIMAGGDPLAIHLQQAVQGLPAEVNALAKARACIRANHLRLKSLHDRLALAQADSSRQLPPYDIDGRELISERYEATRAAVKHLSIANVEPYLKVAQSDFPGRPPASPAIEYQAQAGLELCMGGLLLLIGAGLGRWFTLVI